MLHSRRACLHMLDEPTFGRVELKFTAGEQLLNQAEGLNCESFILGPGLILNNHRLSHTAVTLQSEAVYDASWRYFSQESTSVFSFCWLQQKDSTSYTSETVTSTSSMKACPCLAAAGFLGFFLVSLCFLLSLQQTRVFCSRPLCSSLRGVTFKRPPGRLRFKATQ